MSSRGTGIAIAVVALAVLAAAWLLSDSADSPLVITAVGDTSGYRILGEVDAPADPLAAVRPLVEKSDVFVFNYEGVILSQSPEPGDCPPNPGQSTFYTATPIAEHLQIAPVAIATLANNHVLDCGERGIVETLNKFATRDIHTVGAGASLESACRPLVLGSAGRKLAFLAYLAWPSNEMCASGDSAGAACFEPCGGEQQIASLAERGHIVVASLHLHLAESWTRRAHDAHIELVQDVLEAGADVVIGHGPHMPQGVLKQEGGIGLLSLGNFLFKTDYSMPLDAYKSTVARLIFDDASPRVSLHPIELGRDGIPYPAPSHVADEILHGIAWLSEPFETRVQIMEEDGKARGEIELGPGR